MIPNDMIERIHRFISRTKNGKVNWQKAQDLGFQYSGFGINFGTYSVVLSNGNEDYGKIVEYQFRIINDEGEQALYFDVGSSEDREQFDLLEELYELARRRALKADKILEDLAEKLGSDDEIGHEPTPPASSPPNSPRRRSIGGTTPGVGGPPPNAGGTGSGPAGTTPQDDYAKFDNDIPF